MSISNLRKNTKTVVLEIIILNDKGEGVTPKVIRDQADISASMIHRALKFLCKEQVLVRIGEPPRVRYQLSTMNYEHSKK